MKSLTESPAVLTVHEGARGQYILRVADLRHRPLVIQVTKLLTDASSFVIVTPSDIKVFAVGEEAHGDDGRGDEGSDLPDSIPTPETDGAIPQSVPPEVDEEARAPATRTRKRARPASIAGHDEQCGRCRGVGRVQTLLEGGSPAEVACPICKGSGQMIRYGARR